MPASAGLTATYFAAHYDHWTGFGIQGRALVSSNPELNRFFAVTNGGDPFMRVDDYDAFVIVGLRFCIGPFVLLAEHHASESMAGHDTGRRLLSDSGFEAAGYGALMSGLAADVARQLRSLTDRPIVILPDANPATGVPVELLPWWLARYYAINRPEESWAIRAHFETTCERLGRELQAGIVTLPKEAAANGLLNRQEYSMLPSDITGMPESEILNRMVHANARYAELVLPRVLSAAARSSSD
jgi:hypothetical protein